MKNVQKLNNSLINSDLNQSGSIFIDMDAKRKEVEQLLSDKRDIERKIDEIQANCKHAKTVIKQVADGNGFKVRRVCESCGKIVGYPSLEETQDFLKK
jgi:hypothetical protein